MGVWNAEWQADENQGVWIKRDFVGDNGIQLVINGELVVKLTEEQNRQLWAARNESMEMERKRILTLLEKNLSRFDYSNNGCDPLSYADFAKMTER